MKKWTLRRDQMLREMAARGASYTDMAAGIGTTASAVSNRIARLGIVTKGSQAHSKAVAATKARAQAAAKPEGAFFLDGEPIIFADTSSPCARCAVREDVHHEHGCGNFADQLRVRNK